MKIEFKDISFEDAVRVIQNKFSYRPHVAMEIISSIITKRSEEKISNFVTQSWIDIYNSRFDDLPF